MRGLVVMAALACGAAMGQEGPATGSAGASTGSARTGPSPGDTGSALTVAGPPLAVSLSNRQRIPFGPFGSPRAPVTRDARPERHAAPEATPDTFLYLPYELYRQVLSPVDGATCLHRPSCARYALGAVQRHPVLGLLLAVDRLWRGADSSALRRLPLVREGEYAFFFDPLEESDAWCQRSH